MEESRLKNEDLLCKIKLKNLFDNLKSNYFLDNIFNTLHKKRALEIIKYNDKIKKRLNININNYKEYCETYSSIEIEIIPKKNEYGYFFNLRDEYKNYKNYIHIYFNDNKEEIKRDYINKEDKVTKIKIRLDYQIISFEMLFYLCDCNEFIYFKKFYRNNINNMRGMFWGCKSLKELNLYNFNHLRLSIEESHSDMYLGVGLP